MKVGLYILVLVGFIFIFADNSYAQNLENISSGDNVKLSGNLGTSLVFYDVIGREANRPNFSWMIVGNPVVRFYGITLPFSFTVSEQQRSFQQPFNKFGVSPYYKWAKLHLGYRNINFSKYTLGGHTILGAGGEFTPGKFRLGFMYGRLMKAVDADPLMLNEPYTSHTPTYKRNGLSFKVGYGTENNYFDFIFFKGNDILNSIDAQSQLAVAPAENVVYSLITQQKFLKSFDFYLEYANSIYTKDYRLDSLPVENISGPLNGFIKKNSSTTQGNAVETYLGYSLDFFSLKLRFKQIDPGFKSLGTYYMQNDLRNITIEPGLNLVGGKYILGSSFGFQRDNLENTRAHQTNRNIWSVKFSGKPFKWYNLNVTYSNFDISQNKGLYQLDSLYEISQTTKAYNINQNINVIGESFMHNILLSINNQKLKDKNENTENINAYTSNMIMGSYMVSYLPYRMNISLTYSYSHFELATMDTRYYGPVISYSASLFKNRMNISLSESLLNNKVDNKKKSDINIFSLMTSYKINKKHLIKARYNIHKNNSIDNSADSYKETKGEIGYSFLF